jgi:hypothetical protein
MSSVKTEGLLKVAKAVEPCDLTWLEVDTWDPQALALIRSRAPVPRLFRIGDRAARVSAIPERLCVGCRDHRRALERLP